MQFLKREIRLLPGFRYEVPFLPQLMEIMGLSVDIQFFRSFPGQKYPGILNARVR